MRTPRQKAVVGDARSEVDRGCYPGCVDNGTVSGLGMGGGRDVWLCRKEQERGSDTSLGTLGGVGDRPGRSTGGTNPGTQESRDCKREVGSGQHSSLGRSVGE